MPKRRYKKKSYKKRRKMYKKRGRKRPWRSKISWRKMPRQFPDKISVKLKYFSSVKSNPPGTQTVERAYRLNGCNGVDYNLNLGKPNTFIEWSNLYSKYQVKASSIRLDIFNIDTQDIVRVYVCPLIESLTQVGSFPTYTTACEFPYNSNRVITCARAQQHNVIKNYISMKKLTGRTIVDDDFTSQTVATAPNDNPLRAYNWGIFFDAESLDDLNIYYEVSIMYYVTFYARRVLTPSN